MTPARFYKMRAGDGKAAEQMIAAGARICSQPLLHPYNPLAGSLPWRPIATHEPPVVESSLSSKPWVGNSEITSAQVVRHEGDAKLMATPA